MLNRCAVIIIEKYKEAYPELATEEMYETITSEIWKEEKQFGHALVTGMKEFERAILDLDKLGGTQNIETKGKILPGETVFRLVTTYGFPFEIICEIASDEGIRVDEPGFRRNMQAHQELSRVGSEQKFKGGLADDSGRHFPHVSTRHIIYYLNSLKRARGSRQTTRKQYHERTFANRFLPYGENDAGTDRGSGTNG